MKAKIVYRECLTPECESKELELHLLMKAAEVGDFSLAGAQIKFSISALPYLECTVCDGFMWGKIDGTTGEAVFDQTKWEAPQ